MAAPYSLDMRERVVAALAAGMSRAQAAAHYQVNPFIGNPLDQTQRGDRKSGGVAGGTEAARDRGQLLRCLTFP